MSIYKKNTKENFNEWDSRIDHGPMVQPTIHRRINILGQLFFEGHWGFGLSIFYVYVLSSCCETNDEIGRTRLAETWRWELTPYVIEGSL